MLIRRQLAAVMSFTSATACPALVPRHRPKVVKIEGPPSGSNKYPAKRGQKQQAVEDAGEQQAGGRWAAGWWPVGSRLMESPACSVLFKN